METRKSNPDDTVVVVGSGPPAAAATVLLARAGLHVTLLEAGLPQQARGLTVRLGGMTVARIHRQLGTRSKDLTIAGDPASILYEDVAPGGLTNHWSCAVPRFSADDFEDARRAGEAYTWPLGYDDLTRWYDWVEPFLRIAGTTADPPQLRAGKVTNVTSLKAAWQPVADAAHRAGQALLPVPYVYGAQTTLTLSGTVFNAFVRMVKPVLHTGRVTVRYGAHVTQLGWSGERRRVEEVLIRDVQTGAIDRLRCRAVIVAAGAINSAKILLQSVSTDFPDGLGNTHGVLGRYLHDHPIGKAEIELGTPMPFDPAACLTRQPLEKTPPLYAAACLQWSGVGLLVRSVKQGHPGRLRMCGFNVFGTMAPAPINFVALDPSRKSDDGMPGLVLNVRHPGEAGPALVGARDQLIALLDEARLRPTLQKWFVDPVGGAVHFAGTCRMHESPQFGMLNRWGRLHAVPNVIVADSAAFTTGPEKNPVLTAMALSARATDHLIEDIRTGTI